MPKPQTKKTQATNPDQKIFFRSSKPTRFFLIQSSKTEHLSLLHLFDSSIHPQISTHKIIPVCFEKSNVHKYHIKNELVYSLLCISFYCGGVW